MPGNKIEGTPSEEKVLLLCVHCGRAYDGNRSEWCECISDNPTLVCPHCGRCFCDADPTVITTFWKDAPPSLWSKRLAKRFEKGFEPPMVEGNPLRRPLILVADDNEETRIIAYRVLQELGYGVLLARDGIDAFGLAKRYRPDLIITDQVMPHMDGRRLSRMVKEDGELAETRVLLMTGLYKKERARIELLRESKADDFLSKPISYDRLGEVLEGWLAPPSPR